MKALIVLIPVLFLTINAQAETVRYRKTTDPRITLTLIDNARGEITRKVRGGIEVLIEGELTENQSGLLTLNRAEGDVCPGLHIQMFHDIVYGENASAQVRNRYEQAGTSIRDCSGIELLDGDYDRIQK